ncbi:MAG TPA: cobalt ABC transporter ATP-binding protein, partial [Candidatus Limosilactobacillus merdipullorum]|nr:cobalt ABC transporter ATP-binding protein [Candidatus Limosilactobacillus merdipullorum]
MDNRVVLGMYVPTKSYFHRLDPRAKLLVVCWYVILVFLATRLVENLWLTLVLLVMMLITRVPFKMYWRGLKPMAWVIAFTVIIQLLFSSGGHTYWQWGPMHVT